ncbi:MAG: 2'-5' RNA ligase family protein [Chloroflexia bacterium]
MRRELVSQCSARSHLSLLSPRPLVVSPAVAESQIHALSRSVIPFVVKIDSVAVFPKTSVVYLELSAGMQELSNLHDRLATGAFEFNEPFPFHPHITLAQNFDVATVDERYQLAKREWANYQGPKEFLLDRLVFVQNSVTNCWMDLKSFPLLGMPKAPTPNPTRQLSQTY